MIKINIICKKLFYMILMIQPILMYNLSLKQVYFHQKKISQFQRVKQILFILNHKNKFLNYFKNRIMEKS